MLDLLYRVLVSGQAGPEQRRQLDERYPFHPLTAPGMPPVGSNFTAEAERMGGDCANNLQYLYRRALYDPDFQLPVTVRASQVPAPVVPGHLLGERPSPETGGPKPATVMVIGKMPGREEVREQTNYVGPTSEVFFDALAELGIGYEEWSQWYATNLVKWPMVDEQATSLPKAWIKDNLPLLHEEIRLVRPTYILCLGSDASKALLGPKYGVQSMIGRVVEHYLPAHATGEDPLYLSPKVMACYHPAAVYRTTELYGDFLAQLSLFAQLINGVDVGAAEKDINHQLVYTHQHLKHIVDEIRADPDPERRIIAVDGEWHGEHPTEQGSYLRTVQFSTKHGEAYTVVLRHQGGEPAFQPSLDSAREELRRLLKRDPEADYYPRPGGWFLRADLPWLIQEGIDIRDEYAPADTVEGCRTEGGWEGSLAYHAVFESASYSLENVAARLTTCPRWDTALDSYKREYCKEHNLKPSELEGYGFIPDWVLHPYAGYDADATRRIYMRLASEGGLLDQDWFDRPSWLPYWIAHSASLGFLEMERTGIQGDRNQIDRITEAFLRARGELLADFRAKIKWPAFNIDSTPQCVAVLFGDEYMGKRDKQTGEPIRIRPKGAITLGLTPVKSTGKRPRLWEDIEAQGETASYTPSTDKESLGILGQENPLARQLRDLRFLNQVLKSTLRPPVLDEDGQTVVRDGHYTYTAGLAGAIRPNGRIHTHLFQTKETGRAASARPNLMAISKRRESDYARILGQYGEDGEVIGDYTDVYKAALYVAPIRTVLRASEGCVLLESDYVGAELAGLAWMSGDPNMIEHVRRNALPESHPDHYDIHSQNTVRTFQLTCEPTKAGLKAAGHSGLRVAAKNVAFGIPYGRSAEAIARQCHEEGVDVTVVECEQMIGTYYATYPRTEGFLAECRSRSQQERWLESCFGRRRRFVPARDRSIVGEQERQAQNFPIQSLVADAINTTIRNLLAYRRRNPDFVFRIVLQIHDALLFELPVASVRAFVRDETDAAGNITTPSILRQAMVNDVPVWPRRLDGTPIEVVAPFQFGIDTELFVNWGAGLKQEQAEQLGLDPVLV